MNILIVTPGHPGPDFRSLPPSLTAPYLAGLAAPYAKKVSILDLGVSKYNGHVPTPDLVLATTTMAQSDQVFDLVASLKKQGATIVMGGPHATLAYEEDQRINKLADSVVLGEAEIALPRLLEDFNNKQLKPSYAIPVNSLKGIPFSRLDLLKRGRYYTRTCITGTRGCVHDCTYCSIKQLYGHKYLRRPVEEVIEEIKFQTSRPGLSWLDRKLVQFWDDNPAGDLDWFHELLERMIPLKKWWLSQMCMNVADNEATVELMKASGCRGIFVGIESVSKQTLISQNKESINRVDSYFRYADTLLKHGINIIGAIMFGFDQDTDQSLFEETPRILEKMGLTLMQAHLVTPYPHMDYFNQLKAEERLITDQPKYYNGYTVVHRPARIHPYRLQKGFIDARKRFYSLKSILRRMRKQSWYRIPEFLLWNALFYKPNYKSIPNVDIHKWMKFLKKLP